MGVQRSVLVVLKMMVAEMARKKAIVLQINGNAFGGG